MQVDYARWSAIIFTCIIYAQEIRWNLVSIIVLLQFHFKLVFSCVGLKLFQISFFTGSSKLEIDFIMLNVEYSGIESLLNDSSSSFITSDDVDMNVWQTGTGHIGYDRINRLSKRGHYLYARIV